MSLDSLFERPLPAGPLRVLMVCTGNVCRSPLAEALLAQVLGDLPVELASAGTGALVGEQMTEPTQRIAAELGVADPAAHRAKQITEAHVRGADLVLALTREHRRQVVELVPSATRHTFTLRQLARLADLVTADDIEETQSVDPAARMRRAVEAAAQLRGMSPPIDHPEDDDVIDPYRRSEEVYRESADQLVPAVNAVAGLLRRASPGDV